MIELFIVSWEEEKVEKCIEWKRAACQHKVIMTSVQWQNNPRLEEQESTLPEALWFRRNNSCIPQLPSELWYQRYQRAVHCFRQALSETLNPQPDHISAGLLITPLPPGLTRMPWKALPTQNDRRPALFNCCTSQCCYAFLMPDTATCTIVLVQKFQLKAKPRQPTLRHTPGINILNIFSSQLIF